MLRDLPFEDLELNPNPTGTFYCAGGCIHLKTNSFSAFEHQIEQLFFSLAFFFFLLARTWHYISPGQQSLDIGLPDPLW